MKLTNNAFTLLELVIVILVIAILTTLAIPQYQAMRERAIAAEAVNWLGIAMREQQIAAQSGESTGRYVKFTENWVYWKNVWSQDRLNIDPSLDNYIILVAQREKGSYAGSSIIMQRNTKTGTTVWAGTHPGVPKN